MTPSSATRIAPEHDETARLQAVLRKQQAAFAAEGPGLRLPPASTA